MRQPCWSGFNGLFDMELLGGSMDDRIEIGIDVGWSRRRRTCGLAIRAPFAVSRPTVFGGGISVGLFRLDELLIELARLVSGREDAFRSAVLVIDGPVGPQIDAISDRAIDKSCSRGGFCQRAPTYPITHGTGLELSQFTATILRAIQALIPIRPWLGGQMCADGMLIAETNPTVAMALLAPQQVPSTLPAHGRVVVTDGVTYRAKSDWYWRLGGARYAAEVLGDATIGKEQHHEKVAALFALSLAAGLRQDDGSQRSVVALGDSNGIYVVPAEIDESWKSDVLRAGFVAGLPLFSRRGVAEVPSADVHGVAVISASMDRHERSSDAVTVVLNDNGGLNIKANDWLAGVELPCQLRGPDDLAFSVTSTFDRRGDMYRVMPSTLRLAQHRGFTGQHLSKADPVIFEAMVHRAPPTNPSDDSVEQP